MLFYRAALPLSSRTLNFTAGLIRRHRKSIGSPWRRLNPGRPGHPRRQGLPGQRAGESAVQGEQQAGAAEGSQPRPRETPRPRRTGKRPAQDVEHPRQAPLLPLESRPPRQGNPHIATSRSLTRLEKAHTRVAAGAVVLLGPEMRSGQRNAPRAACDLRHVCVPRRFMLTPVGSRLIFGVLCKAVRFYG